MRIKLSVNLKQSSPYALKIRGIPDEYAEMVAAANEIDGDNLFQKREGENLGFAFSFYYKSPPKRPLKYLKNGEEKSQSCQIVAKFKTEGKRKKH